MPACLDLTGSKPEPTPGLRTPSGLMAGAVPRGTHLPKMEARISLFTVQPCNTE